MKIDVARESALKILYKIEEENGYSNLVLDEYIEAKREKLSVKDVNFISEMVYGVVTWKLTIDTILANGLSRDWSNETVWCNPPYRSRNFKMGKNDFAYWHLSNCIFR